MNNRITIQIASRDRHSELALCLQSLRTQSYQDFDIIIGDESQTPVQSCHFLMSIIARLQQEGHRIKIVRNDLPRGVCFIRNLLIKNNTYENKYSARIDDDVILESDYLLKMINGINQGYDLMSGVTPNMPMAEWERQPSFVKPIINDMSLDKDGNIIEYKDDCGYSYIKSEDDRISNIIPATNFRSNAVYLSEIEKKIKYPESLSFVGFREELWFSLQAILKGYKLGVDITAKAFHLQTPSGGCRFPDYAQKVALDQKTTERWLRNLTKEHGDFLSKYKKRVLQ